jgi:hypothetical protein
MLRGIGRLRAKQSSSGPTSANMALWLRKGVGITESSNAVSSWADQSGNGRDVTQSTASAKPTLQAGGAILFDGTADYLQSAGFTLNQPLTIYVRYKTTTTDDNAYIVTGITFGKASIAHLTGGTNEVSIFAGSSVVGAETVPSNTFTSVCGVFNGASSVLQVTNTDSGINPGAAGLDGLTLGVRGDVAGVYFAGEIAEVIVYSVAHDATMRAANLAYLDTV